NNSSQVISTNTWVKKFGGVNNDYSYGVATDRQGNSVIVGGFAGLADYGGGLGSLTCPGSFAMALAKFNSAGTHLWSRSFGAVGGAAIGYKVAVDLSNGNGDIVVVGTFQNSVTFGSTTLTSSGQSIFV